MNVIVTVLLGIGLLSTQLVASDDPQLLAGRRAGRQHADAAGEKYSFGFDNWGEPNGRISWQQYSKAFYNVDLDSNLPMSWFDYAIYNSVVSSLSGGFCFGIASTSLAMNTIGGYRGFCCPTGSYAKSTYRDTIRGRYDTILNTYEGGPADPRLRETIKEMHCHQLSLAAILTYVDQINSRIARNGQRMMSYFEAALANEGPVVACITKSIEPTSEGFMVAHAVVAYNVERTSLTKGKIYIVDPNRCWYYDSHSDSLQNQGYYKDGKNYIEIDGTKWRYVGAATDDADIEQWPVGDNVEDGLANGFLICQPITRVAPAGRSLASLGLAVGNVGNTIRDVLSMIYISGTSSKITQISTPNGRHTFDPATKRYEDDTAKRIDRLVPFFLAMNPKPDYSGVRPHQMFVTDVPQPVLTLDVQTGPDGAELLYAGQGACMKISTPIPNASIKITYDNIASMTPTIHCSSSREGTIAVEVMQVDQYGRGRRTVQTVPATMQMRTTAIPLSDAPVHEPQVLRNTSDPR